MKLNIHITLTVLSGISLAGLLSGCAIPTKEDIARSTTEFNLVAEKAGNEMLLLNIVRASKRRPMYFTSFGKLTGQMSFEYGTGGVSIPFGRIGGGLNGSYSIAPSASYTNSPLFDVTVLDAKEFTNGIMSPVPMGTVEYYWRQGWHKEMLLHLFIRRIEIKNTKARDGKDVYLNYPGDRKEFNRFQKQIQKWKWDIEEKVIAKSIVEENVKDVSKLKDFMEAQKAGLKLRLVKENNKVRRKGKNKEKNKKLCLSHVKYFFTREPIKSKKPANKTKQDKTSDNKKSQKIVFDELQGTIYLRSPEAILYYLGEILRVEIRGEQKGKTNPKIPIIYAGIGECQGTKNWLFYACKATDEDETPCVSVDYEGARYVIPGRSDTKKGCCRDRSMHVLSLVSLLIGQQKKSEVVPTTGVVGVIGR